ncbi:MAG: ABC transporter permease subunit [Sphaerochaetaceae bacterium]|jgi:methyl-galactoside transport system permease protein
MADNNKVISIDEDKRIAEYTDQLRKLRANGILKQGKLRDEMVAAKKNKLLEPAQREQIIADCRKGIDEARADAEAHKIEINSLTKEAVAYVNQVGSAYEAQVEAEQDAVIAQAHQALSAEQEKIRASLEARIAEIEKQSQTVSDAEKKSELNIAKYESDSALFDAKRRCATAVDQAKAAKNQAFIDRVQKNISIRHGKTDFAEETKLKWRNYKFNFKASKFLLDNGLYLAIIIFFVVCIIIAPLKGNGNLLTLPNIFTILEQSSTRMFYALGVAGLILLAGTDLSIGRMVALGAVITGLILHPGTNIVTMFKMGPWNFTAIPMFWRVAMALVLSIVLCTIFSAFAGFFAAKLKMHPFICTLGTQLIIYGLLFFGTSGTPVGSIDSSIKDAIGGRWIIGMTGNGELLTFPKLILPAIFAIIVAWFIWNKTVFGKNMYAVGGNSEAAAVSGISVFWTTLGVFIMAGVFYGCGSFLEAFRANASAGTGQGYELDAIAACVVGGISFNGGIGKIKGAVIGVIIFTGLTYCLTFLGIDTNLQFVFKGFIILAAVSLDSIKYLKKK